VPGEVPYQDRHRKVDRRRRNNHSISGEACLESLQELQATLAVNSKQTQVLVNFRKFCGQYLTNEKHLL